MAFCICRQIEEEEPQERIGFLALFALPIPQREGISRLSIVEIEPR